MYLRQSTKYPVTVLLSYWLIYARQVQSVIFNKVLWIVRQHDINFKVIIEFLCTGFSEMIYSLESILNINILITNETNSL